MFIPTETLKSICHLLPYIPSSQKEAFLEDYYSHVKNTYVARKQQDSGFSPHDFLNHPIDFDYEYISIKARKPTWIMLIEFFPNKLSC